MVCGPRALVSGLCLQCIAFIFVSISENNEKGLANVFWKIRKFTFQEITKNVFMISQKLFFA